MISEISNWFYTPVPFYQGIIWVYAAMFGMLVWTWMHTIDTLARQKAFEKAMLELINGKSISHKPR